MTLSESMNLARRLSVVNEPELVQEDYHTYSEQECQKIAVALEGNLNRLPLECKAYVGKSRPKLESKKTKTPVDPLAGMNPGQRGMSSHAVIQRRYTRTKK
mmetsp:Transcript_12652/g.15964  ORF Transcript_12652/g.15964 Transcript_12652/m.15964 type:complete len:101 (-) Transcript_12652:300-602(-)